MKKLLLIGLLFSFLFIRALAQDFEFGKWTYEKMNMPVYENDTAAHAVVLKEHGNAKTALVGDFIRLVYDYHVRIKVFDNTGFKHGTIEIPLYLGKEAEEEASLITGLTIYKDDNGLVKTEELEQSKIYTAKENQNHSPVKFAMPAMRNGCIIEYKYRIITPFFEDLHDWQFQSDVPKITSEYETHVPGF